MLNMIGMMLSALLTFNFLLLTFLHAQEPERSQTRIKVPPAEQALQGKAQADAPITISADEVVYRGKQKVNVWKGHVTVKRARTTMTAEKVTASMNRDSALAEGQVLLTDPDEGMTLNSRQLEYKNKLKHITATGDPQILMKTPDARTGKESRTFIKGDVLEILSEEKVARAQGHVLVVREDIMAEADRAEYFDSEQRMELSGNPCVIKGENEFLGDKITAFLKDNRIVLDGHVSATLYPDEFSEKEAH